MEDDYGDRTISGAFYSGGISREQKRVANRTRNMIEGRVGRFSTLKSLVGGTGAGTQEKRANNLFTRVITVQWVQGTAAAAESSFYKINTQGTPLNEIEEMLIRNRRKPIAISARAILRSASGHKYWSLFDFEGRSMIEEKSRTLFMLLFEPEADPPIKTLDLPFAGAVSPIDALSVLVEFLTITTGEEVVVPVRKGVKERVRLKAIDEYPDDPTGAATIEVLNKAVQILSRITGNSAGSLGLHPAVYFYNERGKHSRFLFLAMTMLIAERLRNNDGAFFRKFTQARSRLEKFLIDNKSLIGILLQNMNKGQRVPNTKELLAYLVSESAAGHDVTPEMAIATLGLRGRVFDVVAQHPPHFTDDVKSMAFIQKALETALKCPVCDGLLDPNKSVSYDHRVPLRDDGGGEPENVQLAHPYCNTGVKG
jgi:HNH endonuclease